MTAQYGGAFRSTDETGGCTIGVPIRRGGKSMTKSRTYVMTALAAALFIFLNWAFADQQFSGNWWNSDAIASSNIWTYVLLALIVVAGVAQARVIPPEGI